jgi:hypothetical protein
VFITLRRQFFRGKIAHKGSSKNFHLLFQILRKKIAVETAIFSCASYQQQEVFRASRGFPAAEIRGPAAARPFTLPAAATTLTGDRYACRSAIRHEA